MTAAGLVARAGPTGATSSSVEVLMMARRTEAELLHVWAALALLVMARVDAMWQRGCDGTLLALLTRVACITFLELG